MKTKIIAMGIAVVSLALSSMTINAKSFTTLDKLSKEDKPASIIHKATLPQSVKIIAPELDKKSLQKQDLIRESNNLPYRFSIEAEGVDKKGQWQIQGDTAIWRLTVSSKTAESFSFGLKNVFLPQQAKLYFYTNDYKNLVGPYTHKDNKKHKQLWSPVMESNEVTVEINVPVKFQSLLSFDLASISQGYRGIKSDDLAKSGSCNNDVVCSEADAWINEIRSVARYTIEKDGSTFLCTGTLMNNTNDDLKPYFLTAGHCGVDETTDASIIIYWNYETSSCGGTPDGSLNQFQNGTTYLAGTGNSGVVGSDFVIVELDSTPDSSFNVYWSGWDRSAAAPSSGVGIHHPAGDEKRISFDNDPLLLTGYGENTEDTSNTHMRVGAWDDGTTEGGSSGSGLWNSEHRLVGTLSGGAASCQAQTAPDWYGRLSVHWEGNGTGGKAKDWLDPVSTGAMTLDGRYGCEAPTVTISSSPASANIGDALNFTASATGGSGSYTFSWDFNQDGLSDETGDDVGFSYNYLFQGNVLVTATDSVGCPGTDSAAIVISNNGDELFPKNNALPTDWQMSSGANASWAIDSTTKTEGDSSIQSVVVLDNETAAIEVTQTFDNANENFISFAYKVSSEAGFDKFVFSIDGDEKISRSGEVDWTTSYYSLTAGAHTLKWSYVKDESVSEGSDAAWIDGVTGISFPNEAPIAAVANDSQTVDEGTSVTLDASSSSDPDGDALTYAWTQTAGSPAVTLANATTSIASFTAPDVSSNTTFTFMVTVTDPSGESSTAEINVTVNNIVVVTPPPAPPVASSSGGGSFAVYMFGLLLLTGLTRRNKKA